MHGPNIKYNRWQHRMQTFSVQLFKRHLSVNSNFLSDKTINKSDIFRLKSLSVIGISAILCVITLFHLTFYKLNDGVETDFVHNRLTL